MGFWRQLLGRRTPTGPGSACVGPKAGAPSPDRPRSAAAVDPQAAAAQQHAVEQLRALGIDAHSRTRTGEPQLVEAARANNLTAVQLLLAAGCRVDATGPSTNTALHEAAAEGHAAVVETLLSALAKPNVANARGVRPLHFAARFKDRDVARLLLHAGADPRVRDDAGTTPLHEAASRGSRDIVEMLLSAKADPAATTPVSNGGTSVLHCAVRGGDAGVVEALLSVLPGGQPLDAGLNTPLHDSADRGNRDIARILLAAGADVSAKNSDGNTPLHLAVAGGHRDLVALLLEAKADVSARNSKGETSLLVLKTKLTVSNADIAARLMRSGSSPGETNSQGEKAIDRLSAANERWREFFRTGSLDLPAGLPEGVSDEVVEVSLEAESKPTPHWKIETFLAGGSRAESAQDRALLARMALALLPGQDQCTSELARASRYDDPAIARGLQVVGACLLAGEQEHERARAVLAAWESKARELRLVENARDAVMAKNRLASTLRDATLYGGGEGTKHEYPSLERVENVDEVFDYVAANLTERFIQVDAATVGEFAALSCEKHLSPSYYPGTKETLAGIRSSLGRMRQDRGFWRFFASVSFHYRCLHIESSHADNDKKYRKHLLVWKVDGGFAVAASDYLNVFGQ